MQELSHERETYQTQDQVLASLSWGSIRRKFKPVFCFCFSLTPTWIMRVGFSRGEPYDGRLSRMVRERGIGLPRGTLTLVHRLRGTIVIDS